MPPTSARHCNNTIFCTFDKLPSKNRTHTQVRQPQSPGPLERPLTGSLENQVLTCLRHGFFFERLQPMSAVHSARAFSTPVNRRERAPELYTRRASDPEDGENQNTATRRQGTKRGCPQSRHAARTAQPHAVGSARRGRDRALLNRTRTGDSRMRRLEVEETVAAIGEDESPKQLNGTACHARRRDVTARRRSDLGTTAR